MDEELEKMTRRNELKNKACAWGMFVLFVVVLLVLAKMFVSAM